MYMENMQIIQTSLCMNELHRCVSVYILNTCKSSFMRSDSMHVCTYTSEGTTCIHNARSVNILYTCMTNILGQS
jgi:hypothetical protein